MQRGNNIDTGCELRIGAMLPNDDVAVGDGRKSIPLRSNTGETTVIVWRHAFACEACDSFLRSLDDLAVEFQVWDARLVVFGEEVDRELIPAFGATACGDPLCLPGAGILVADRYGQIFYVRHDVAGHVFPTPRELTEWLKHLGTLCPE